jgi:hypothetical protein
MEHVAIDLGRMFTREARGKEGAENTQVDRRGDR